MAAKANNAFLTARKPNMPMIHNDQNVLFLTKDNKTPSFRINPSVSFHVPITTFVFTILDGP